ncbi:hypothetical protein [Bradyrhizobium sp. AUGA SZCCT0283]|uniref:hypothetical protein n=1 Tax=Bradyrhizobium sp. AUGA SZCCT0283 TaxID=2807671 RepID=UPI001BAC7B12|nr:hypothetical protein [Bradyrhizobium sp. AUGA SZCCT0283]MBR1279367.1 hypothetical protein [Bradyrhizobium sp. AUGA SZCCT0283]
MSVIKHDFGSEDRKAVRRLRTALELGALHEANIRNNPLPYLERASERIFQLEEILFEAVEAATSASPVSSETISVSKAEYDRFLACLAIIENGLARLVSDAEDPTSA